MKKKLVILIGILMCLSLIFMGCKSKPEDAADESPVEEVAPVEAELTAEQLIAMAGDEIEQARKNRARIEGLEFTSFDSASFEAGNAAVSEYEALSDDVSPKDRYAVAKKANDFYKQVLAKGFAELASQKKAEADKARKSCLDVKADKASKENFESADFTYKTAGEHFGNSLFEMSYNSYCKALISFTEIYDEVLAKREKADQAIADAKEKTEQVEKLALEADKINPLPDNAAVDAE